MSCRDHLTETQKRNNNTFIFDELIVYKLRVVLFLFLEFIYGGG